MAKELVAALGSLGPIAMLVVVFGVTALVGLFVSNSATAVLIGPIAIDAAQTLHVSPYAFAMTVSIACCAAYVTPVSSPVNMLVMEAFRCWLNRNGGNNMSKNRPARHRMGQASAL